MGYQSVVAEQLEKLEEKVSPIIESEEHASLMEVRWMWADAGSCAVPFSARLAKRNPLRWSSLQNLEQTIADLQSWKLKDCVRPVRFEMLRDAEGAEKIQSENVCLEAALAELSSQRTPTVRCSASTIAPNLSMHTHSTLSTSSC